MHNLRQDSIHLLMGVAVSFAIVGAIVVGSGVLLMFLLVLAPAEIRQAIPSQMSEALLPAVLFLLAVIQVALWYWLPKLGFIGARSADRMLRIMGVLAFFLFMTLIFSL